MQPRELWLLGAALAAYFVLEAHDGGRPEQTWRLSRTGTSESVQFTVRSVTPHRRVQWTSPVPLNQLRGLSAESLSGPAGRVQFALVNEAGVLLCEGTIRFGQGSGAFTFRPDPDFGEQLRKLGYEMPDRDTAWDLAQHGVTLDFARRVRDSGIRANTRDLVRLRQHGID